MIIPGVVANQSSGGSSGPIQLEADGAYSWWHGPEAISRDGLTYFGYTSSGDIYVNTINNSTKVLGTPFKLTVTPYTTDDHNDCAIGFTSTGKLIVAYCGHGEDSVLRYRVSTDSTIANLGSEQTKTFGGTTTFPNIVRVGQNIIVLVNRGDDRQDYMLSTNDGSTFTVGATSLFFSADAFTFGYLVDMPGRERIRMFIAPHPNTPNTPIRLAELDLSAVDFGSVTADGEHYGRLDGTSAIVGGATLPMASDTEATPIYTPASGKSLRLLAVNPTGDAWLAVEFTFATFNGAKLVLGVLSGSNPFDPNDWDITDLIADYGQPFYTGSSGYFPGAAFERAPHATPRMYIARKASGTSYLEQYDADTWAGPWDITEITNSPDDEIIRPYCPFDSDARVGLLYLLGDYTDFNSPMSMHRSAVQDDDWDIDNLKFYVNAPLIAEEDTTPIFLVQWNGAPIDQEVTIVLDVGGSSGAFTNSLDTDVASAVSTYNASAGSTVLTYDSGTNTLTIAAGGTSPFAIPRALDPGVGEGGEITVSMVVSDPSKGTVVEGTATVTIPSSITLGPEIVINGNAGAAAPPPTLGSEVTINSGHFRWTTSSNAGANRQATWSLANSGLTGDLVNGNTYRLTFDFVASSWTGGGSLIANVNQPSASTPIPGATFASGAGATTITYDFVAGANTTLVIGWGKSGTVNGGGFIDYDNVSLKEVT